MKASTKGWLAWALSRAREPSTWSGLAAVVASMTFLPHAQTDAQVVSTLGACVAGLVGIYLREGGSPR